MTEAVKPETIKRTQEMLGKYVRKPPLTNKLLGKPPFRYLHDIINSVINDTGFLKGLYKLEELSSDNIKDKEAKITFLQKSIDATSIALGEDLTVRPSKIVAGHEVEQTNEWLQAIATAIERKVNSETAVKQVLSGTKVTKVKSNNVADKKTDKVPKETIRKKKEDIKPSTNGTARKAAPKVSSSPQIKIREKDALQKEKAVKKEKPEKEKTKKSSKIRKEDKNTRNGMVNGLPSDKIKENVIPIVDDSQKENIQNPIESPPIVQLIQENSPEMAPSNIEPKATRASPSNLEQVTEKDSPLPDKDDLLATEIPLFAANSSIADSHKMQTFIEGDIEGNTEAPADSKFGLLGSPKVLEDRLPPNGSADGARTPINAKENIPQMSNSIASKPKSSRAGPLKAHHTVLANQMQPDQPEIEMSTTKERPTTGRGIRPLTERRSARPSSARPAPPKVRERREISNEEVARPPTAKLVTNVILDSSSKDEESLEHDDDHFTVGETKPLPMEDMEILSGKMSGDFNSTHEELLDGNTDSKGLLVAQIIESKKELEDERRESFSPETPGHRRVPIDTGFGDLKVKKDQELIRKEVEDLNGKIQSLTRSVIPLAKMLDYLQEDLDSMYKELDNWKEENKTLNQSLKNDQSKIDGNFESLNAQLEELERAIYDCHDRISAVKSNILRNDEKIHKLLTAINLS